MAFPIVTFTYTSTRFFFSLLIFGVELTTYSLNPLAYPNIAFRAIVGNSNLSHRIRRISTMKFEFCRTSTKFEHEAEFKVEFKAEFELQAKFQGEFNQ